MYNFKIITSLIIVDKENKFLLGKRSMDEDVFPGLWSIPGGKVEKGRIERNVLEKNVLKEVLEEFGVHVGITDYVESHSDGKEKIYVIFLGKILRGIPKPLEDTDEVKWFSFDELDEKVLCPEIYRILEEVKTSFI